MDEEIERLVVSVRADTAGFARDVDTMRANLDGPLSSGVERAGRTIENALGKALKTGSFGFEDLRKVALSVLNDIAAAAIRTGLDSIFGGGGGGSGGRSFGGGLLDVLGGLLGAPGRATGGPVSPLRPYVVGERGPELFVPTASGSVVAAGGGGTRDVRVSITVQGAGEPSQMLAASSRQVARAVRAALAE